MRIWIDTEFNEYKGSLIAIALIAEDNEYFYEVMECDNPTDWVCRNVIPVLGKSYSNEDVVRINLMKYLNKYKSIELVSDWPEDIIYFCSLLLAGPGKMIDTPPISIEIRRDINAVSKIPHNALADALAIRSAHLAIENSS